jgi:hypothetical protein
MMYLRASYEKKCAKKFFFGILKVMKKGVRSGVGSGSGSISQRYVSGSGSGSGSAPKCHGSPTPVIIFLFLAMSSKKELTKLLAVRWNLLTAEQKQVSSYCKTIFI